MEAIKNLTTGGTSQPGTPKANSREGAEEWGETTQTQAADKTPAPVKRDSATLLREQQEALGILPGRSGLTMVADVTPQPEKAQTTETKDCAGEFPDGLDKAIKLLQVWRHELHVLNNPATKGNLPQRIALREKLARLERHIMRLQNGPPDVPPLDANRQVVEVEARRSVLKRFEARFDAIVEALNKNEPVKLPEVVEVDEPLALTPRERLLNCPLMRKTLHELCGHFLIYAGKNLQSQELLDPLLTVERLQREMADCKDLNRIAQLRVEIAEAKDNVKTRTGVIQVRNILLGYYEPVRAKLDLALTWAADRLLKWRDEAVEAETAWLAKYGCAHEATALSRRYEAELKKFKAAMEAQARPDAIAGLPNSTRTAITDLLGLSLP